MKRKIIIFAFCVSLLLGVFSISAFAEETNSFTVDFPLVFNETIDTSITFNVSLIQKAYVKPFGVHGSLRLENGQLIFNYNKSGQLKDAILYDSINGWGNDEYRTFYQYSIGYSSLIVNEELFNWFTANSTSFHDHSYSSSIVSPTHTDKGYTLYTCECGDSYQDNFIAALGHNYTITEKVDSSCTTKGYTTYVCDCGDTYTEEGAAYGHTFTTTTVDPTCTRKGSITYVCDCGYSYSEDIPTLPHTYSSSVVDPTCSRKGYTMYTCECGYSYRDNYVDAIPHVFEGSRCSVCNALDPSYIIKSKDFSNVFLRLSEQIKVNTVVGVLGVAAAACVGLVFMWWGVRKLVRALMAAIKKGKMSL